MAPATSLPVFVPRTIASYERAAGVLANRWSAPALGLTQSAPLGTRFDRFANRFFETWGGVGGGVGEQSQQQPRMAPQSFRASPMVMTAPWMRRAPSVVESSVRHPLQPSMAMPAGFDASAWGADTSAESESSSPVVETRTVREVLELSMPVVRPTSLPTSASVSPSLAMSAPTLAASLRHLVWAESQLRAAASPMLSLAPAPMSSQSVSMTVGESPTYSSPATSIQTSQGALGDLPVSFSAAPAQAVPATLLERLTALSTRMPARAMLAPVLPFVTSVIPPSLSTAHVSRGVTLGMTPALSSPVFAAWNPPAAALDAGEPTMSSTLAPVGAPAMTMPHWSAPQSLSLGAGGNAAVQLPVAMSTSAAPTAAGGRLALADWAQFLAARVGPRIEREISPTTQPVLVLGPRGETRLVSAASLSATQAQVASRAAASPMAYGDVETAAATSFVAASAPTMSYARPGALALQASNLGTTMELRALQSWGVPVTTLAAMPASVMTQLTRAAASTGPATSASTVAGVSSTASAPAAASYPTVRFSEVWLQPSAAPRGEAASPLGRAAPTPYQGETFVPRLSAATAELSRNDWAADVGTMSSLATTATPSGVFSVAQFVERLLGVEMLRASTPRAIADAGVFQPQVVYVTPPAGRAAARELVAAGGGGGGGGGALSPSSLNLAGLAGLAGQPGQPGLAPGEAGVRAEQLGGFVGVRAAGLMTEFADPATLSSAAALFSMPVVSPARTPASTQSLTPAAIDTLMALVASNAVEAPVAMAPSSITSELAAPSVVGEAARAAAAQAATSMAATPMTPMTSEEWALISLFRSESSAMQLASRRLGSSWQLPVVSPIFSAPRQVEASAPFSPQGSLADLAMSFAPLSSRGVEDTTSSFTPTLVHAAHVGDVGHFAAGMTAGSSGSHGSTSTFSTRAPNLVAVTVPAGDRRTLPGGARPRGGVLWPSLPQATTTPLPMLSMLSNTQLVDVQQAVAGSPLWESMPKLTNVVGGHAATTTSSDAEAAFDDGSVAWPQMMAARGGAPASSASSGMPMVAAGARGQRAVNRPVVAPARRSPAEEAAAPFLELVRAGSTSAAASASSSSPSAVASSDAALKLVEAARHAPATAAAPAGDGRITLGDLTLITFASINQQVAASAHGAAPAGGGDAGSGHGHGGGGAHGGGGGKGGGAPDINVLAYKVFDELQRLLEIERERSGDPWES